MEHNYFESLRGVWLRGRSKRFRRPVLMFVFSIFMFIESYPSVIKNSNEKLELIEVQQTITGLVTDEEGLPLPGVTVRIKGVNEGDNTNMDGEFSIKADPDDILVVSFVGFETQEIPVGDRSVIDITLVEDVGELNEVVVVGYGEQSKATLSGSVASVGSEVFENIPISNPIAALQGTLPGSIIQRGSGRPGDEGFSVNVRGFSSVNGTGEALVIIDGIPGDLSEINPNDIESTTVLKDAAASIYGARAAGGVLLVTTKKGKIGEPRIQVNASYSHRVPTGMFDQLNSAQVAEMHIEASENAGQTSWIPDGFIEDVEAGNVHPVDVGWNTIFTGNWDWTDLVLGTGSQQNYDINLSGANESSRYRASVGYIEEEGVYNYGNDNNRRLNARLNYNYDINDKLKIDTRLSFSRKKRQAPSMDAMFRINTMYPFQPPTVWEDDSKWGSVYENPLQELDEGGTQNFNDTRLDANLKMDYQVHSNLTLTGQVGSNYRFNHHKSFFRTFETYHAHNGSLRSVINDPNAGEEVQNDHVYYTAIGYINYDENFKGLHDISITGGASTEKEKHRFFSARRTGFPTNDSDFSLNLGDSEDQTNNGGGSDWVINSFFGRASYVFDNKYIFETNFRYDGSSRFAPETRWGFFWGASGAWRLTEEKFIQDLNVFDNLKMRLSYGETGNQDGIGLYDYVQNVNIGGTYPFGDGARIANASLGGLVDPNRSWETIKTQNIGLDFGLLDNRLSGSFDYFIKNNEDMLTPITLPSVLGASAPAGNNGSLRAWGWEGVLNWKDQINENWSYDIGLNISDSENKVIEYGGQDTYSHGLVQVREGYPINTYHGYISDGLITSQEELDAYSALEGVPGDIGIGDAKYKDLNNDGEISVYGEDGEDGDVVPLGSTTPRYTYGVNIGVQFKNFEFSTLVQGVGKKQIQMDGDWRMPWVFDWHKPDSRWYHNTWSPERPNNPNPRQTHGNIRHWNYAISNRTAIDASYTRLKNISIGYNLPKRLLTRIGIQKAKVYAVGYDLWEKQNLGGGYDVEALKVGQAAALTYPYNKNYTIGLNLNF